MSATTIQDARGARVPLFRGPRRREWPRGWFGAGRKIAALGEPWVTEFNIAKKWASAYGMMIGVAFWIEFFVFRTMLTKGLFGLSIGMTAGLCAVCLAPLYWLTTPLFTAQARR